MTTTANPVRTKALAAIRERRVTVVHAVCRKTAHDVDEVIARVVSSQDNGPVYVVDLLDATWTCTCPDAGDCVHVAAVQLVTGHPSAAAA